MSLRRSGSGFGGRRPALLAAIVVAVAAAGCGASSFPNEPRAAAPIEVTASIGPRAVKVSPRRVGAGLANFTVANLSSNPASFRIQGPTSRSSEQIAPGAVTSLTEDLKTGDYELSAPGSGFHGAGFKVGGPRPSSQNKLLLP